jgi:lysozyme
MSVTRPPPAALRDAAPHRRRWRLALIVAALAMIAALLGWRALEAWQPDRGAWPMQGVAVGADNAPIAWATLARLGANFAYVDATAARRVINPRFPQESTAAAAAGLRVGAIHHFALCDLASEQAAQFVRLVPRAADALPPLVLIDDNPACTNRPTRALLLSELATFLAQVETHMGKPAIIGPSAAIEEQYQVSEAINRSLLARRDWREPPGDGPDWVLWQANSHLKITGAQGAVRWLVLRGSGV